jgi:hypothetical protein
MPDVLAAGRCLAHALQVLYGLHPSAVHVCSSHVTHALGGAMSGAFSMVVRSYVDVLNSY